MEDELILKKISEARRKRLKEMWWIFKHNRAAYLSLYVLLFIVGMTVLGLIYTPYDPYDFDLSRVRQSPSLKHLLGTDELGRDILSRIMVGARYTIGISVTSVFLGTLLGSTLGLISGYFGGRLDTIIQRVVDVALSFPTTLLAIALMVSLGPGVLSLIIAVSISTFPVYARLVRGAVLQLINEDYITAVRLLGRSSWYIMFKHVLPNVASLIIVQSTYYLGFSILLASSLGFLGLGIPPPTPEWGAMIGGGRVYLFSSPHIVVFPGLFIMAASLAFNLIGDGLRDALDPKSRMFIRRF
ncbi:MAG: ABC transporter permease [Sulfolobales archaeon]